MTATSRSMGSENIGVRIAGAAAFAVVDGLSESDMPPGNEGNFNRLPDVRRDVDGEGVGGPLFDFHAAVEVNRDKGAE